MTNGALLSYLSRRTLFGQGGKWQFGDVFSDSRVFVAVMNKKHVDLVLLSSYYCLGGSFPQSSTAFQAGFRVLIDFFVSNFRSYKGEQGLNMVANGRIQSHTSHLLPIAGQDKHALKTAVIYGANASGKSNLVLAMDLARDFVLLGSKVAKRLGQNQFGRSGSDPSQFQFLFQAEGYLFDYGFEIKGETIVSEWLTVESSLKTKSEISIFKRELNEVSIGKFSRLADYEMSSGVLETLISLGIKPNQLFLNHVLESTSRDKRGEVLNAALSWFLYGLNVILPRASHGSLISLIDNEEGFRAWAAEFLASASTGITEMRVDQTKIDAEDLPSEMVKLLQDGANIASDGIEFGLDDSDSSIVVRRNLKMIHSTDESEFELPASEESDGTRRLLELLPALYQFGISKNEYDGDSTFVIDELDRSLHPVLSHAFLKFFLETNHEKSHQLIVTTHETHLLDSDLLRRDEVWFVEKDKTQQSRVYSLLDFKIRKDLRLEKGYLQGRFGGIPFVGNMDKLRGLLHHGETETEN